MPLRGSPLCCASGAHPADWQSQICGCTGMACSAAFCAFARIGSEIEKNRRQKMSDIRLVNVVPIVNGWNDAAKKNLEEAKTLMASGNHLDYNKGVVKESVANLVSGFADDLMKAPAVDPESRRPVSHWVLQRSVAYCERCRKGYRITNGGANVLTFSYCPNCGAKMEDNNA